MKTFLFVLALIIIDLGFFGYVIHTPRKPRLWCKKYTDHQWIVVGAQKICADGFGGQNLYPWKGTTTVKDNRVTEILYKCAVCPANTTKCVAAHWTESQIRGFSDLDKQIGGVQ